MPAPYSLIPGSPTKMLDNATTGAGGTLLLEGQNARLTIYFQGSGTTTTGTLAIEEAFYDRTSLQPTGTWSNIQTVNASELTTGASKAVHITGSAWAVRVRVSAQVTGGGSVTAWAYGS